MKYHIKENSVEETLVIPLYARYIAEGAYPYLKGNRDTKKIIDSLDYDFSTKGKNRGHGLLLAKSIIKR